MKKVKNFLPPLLTIALASSLSCSVIADDVLLAEKQLLSGLKAIQTLSVDRALEDFNGLSERYPNYKLAQLIKADLLALKAGQKSILDKVHQKNPKLVAKLQDEAVVRWQFSQSDFPNNSVFEQYVLKTAQQPHLVLVSLSESRLYFYERDANGQMQQVADYYISMGRKGGGKQREGDLRTPIGVYHIIDLLPDDTLPDLYGVGALPLNYPNEWDLAHGKTGSGIWLHGTPRDTYIRAPKASRGCVVLNNTAMERLLAMYRLPFETPFLIVDNLNNLQLEQQASNNQEAKDLVLLEVKKWLNDHYIGVDWNSVSVYRYPDEKDLLYVTFPANVENQLVHQYWQRGDNGDWKLVIESQNVNSGKKV